MATLNIRYAQRLYGDDRIRNEQDAYLKAMSLDVLAVTHLLVAG
jgi:hypothetical protein